MKVTEGYCLPLPSRCHYISLLRCTYYVRSKFEHGLSCVARSKNGLRKVVGELHSRFRNREQSGDGGALSRRREPPFRVVGRGSFPLF